MKRDRIKWNKRYLEKDPGQRIPGIVRDYIDLAPVGRALDIACGSGAISLFLAERGFTVDAVDISDVALATCMAQHPAIQGVCADLDTFDLARGRYHLITNIRYLNRRLFPQIITALRPGGILMFETFLKSREKEMDSGFKRKYLLDEQELPDGFASLNILFYEESDSGRIECPPRIASLVGVKP
ncbi:MAG: class I SAM-dependent methyltransferase [Desulfobacterales bacterium]|nr:class I SAM-dependent methyltransferase [Desulfobacterales bacterium]